ncbi:hypothetical protein Ssi02_56950 [Sinosporangium siamense]|uniref:Uncharacterized protein n=1 Tax=Sinosporangium siamense TaxID=1367973 RepID=A0A919VEU0_9ACTN|nr:hypothetical protein Ssi02_56950 [Sinosporangium siamense]
MGRVWKRTGQRSFNGSPLQAALLPVQMHFVDREPDAERVAEVARGPGEFARGAGRRAAGVVRRGSRRTRARGGGAAGAARGLEARGGGGPRRAG